MLHVVAAYVPILASLCKAVNRHPPFNSLWMIPVIDTSPRHSAWSKVHTDGEEIIQKKCKYVFQKSVKGE